MNKTNTNALYKTIKILFLAITAFYTVFPLWVMFWGGFKTTGGIRGNPFGFPKEFQLGTFAKILNPMTSSYFANLANSLIIMAGSVVFAVILCCLTGFTFARIKFWGREVFYNYFLLGLLFPLAVAILPMYLQMRKVGLIDTYLGVMLPQAAFGLAFNTMLTRSFFAQIPVLSLVGSWNQFLLPLLILNDQKKYTLPLGVMQYQGQYSTDWSQVLAYLTLSLIPVIIFYALAQKQIVAGLTSGSVKE